MLSKRAAGIVVLATGALVAVFFAGCPALRPLSDLSLDMNAITLGINSPSATVTVTNAGDAGSTFSWHIISPDQRMTVHPMGATGKDITEVLIEANDFSECFTAVITITNGDDPRDWEFVYVDVTGIEDGGVVPGDMVLVPSGWFEMGDPFREGGENELPVHDVRLSSYLIGKYEVTNQEFANILNWANERGYLSTASESTAEAYGVELLRVRRRNCQIDWNGTEFVVGSREGYPMADHPVGATWHGAAAYCNWLSESQGLTPCYDTATWEFDLSVNGYHLPTEAQWERAAAWDPAGGGRHYRYANGRDDLSCGSANCWPDAASAPCNPLGFLAEPFTTPVGYYPHAASPAGCFDMSGNKSEVCNDWMDLSDYYPISPSVDPEGPPPTGWGHVSRGGGYRDCDGCRSASRRMYWPLPGYDEGPVAGPAFRIAR